MQKTDKEREMPHTDLLMVALPIIFILATVADVLTCFSTFLGNFLDPWLRFFLGAGIFTIGILLLMKTHSILFNKAHEPPKTVISSGIFGRMRHPLYFGVLLIFIGVFVMTFSLIALALCVLYFFIFDKMATFEERILEELFGDAYRDYKMKVPKWFPKLQA